MVFSCVILLRSCFLFFVCVAGHVECFRVNRLSWRIVVLHLENFRFCKLHCTWCRLCFHDIVSLVVQKRFKTSSNRILLSLWLILLVYYLSLLLLHVFVTEIDPFVVSHTKIQLLPFIFQISPFVVFSKIGSVIVKNMAYYGRDL